MSNTRFILTNWAESGTVKNGSGGGAPARDESGLFTMERALNADRSSLWKTAGTVSVYYFDIDLGSARSVNVGALLGLSVLEAEDTGTLLVQYASSYYPGAWTSLATKAWAAGDRDVGAVASSPVSARYWRVNFACTTASRNASVGRIVLGTTATYDLGGIHSPGGISSPFQNRIEQAMEDGSFNVNTLGFPGRDFSWPFNQVTSTVRDQLLAVAAARGSVVLVDAEDLVYEVLITGGRASVARNTDSLFNVVLEGRRMP